MTARIERLRELLEEPLLVTNLVNVLYLTGFDSSNAALLVEPDRARLFTDFRYIESARAIEGVEAVQTKRAVIGWLCENLSGRIGFEADVLPWSFAEQLREAGIELVPRKGLVEQLRAVKDEGELETFRRACAITDRMFERLVSEVPFVGRRERDVAWDITRLYHEEGADEPAFEAIVGSGPTGARPHGRAGDRVIEAGELVVIDTGANFGGYVSDYTRTLATGELDGEMREAYDVVLAAQQAGLDAIRSGVRGIDADAAARGVIEGSDFAGTFGHGLGHGVGLDVHESPRLSTESSDTLVAGNVVTVEPGVYLKGRFGIRIEDDVVVTDDGIENVDTNSFKNGMHIELDGKVWRIVEFQHVKPGKGGAFVRTKLKSLEAGAVVDRTFRAGEKFPRVHTETKNVQFLYDDGSDVHFMDAQTYEQFALPHADLTDALPYMQPNASVQVLSVNGKPSSLQLPASVELAVVETEPGVKGDTVSNVTKPAKLETGAVVNVPLFVNVGDRLKVDPREGRYISRA